MSVNIIKHRGKKITELTTGPNTVGSPFQTRTFIHYKLYFLLSTTSKTELYLGVTPKWSSNETMKVINGI
jgi:hypothetical protein